MPIHHKVLAASIVTAWLLPGCAPSYGPLSAQGGYKDVELRPGVYYVDYIGNARLDRETVVAYWRRRAWELCPAGYEILADEAASPTGLDVSETRGIVSASGEFRCK